MEDILSNQKLKDHYLDPPPKTPNDGDAEEERKQKLKKLKDLSLQFLSEPEHSEVQEDVGEKEETPTSPGKGKAKLSHVTFSEKDKVIKISSSPDTAAKNELILDTPPPTPNDGDAEEERTKKLQQLQKLGLPFLPLNPEDEKAFGGQSPCPATSLEGSGKISMKVKFSPKEQVISSSGGEKEIATHEKSELVLDTPPPTPHDADAEEERMNKLKQLHETHTMFIGENEATPPPAEGSVAPQSNKDATETQIAGHGRKVSFSDLRVVFTELNDEPSTTFFSPPPESMMAMMGESNIQIESIDDKQTENADSYPKPKGKILV